MSIRSILDLIEQEYIVNVLSMIIFLTKIKIVYVLMNAHISLNFDYGLLLEYSKRVYFRFDDNTKSNFFVIKSGYFLIIFSLILFYNYLSSIINNNNKQWIVVWVCMIVVKIEFTLFKSINEVVVYWLITLMLVYQLWQQRVLYWWMCCIVNVAEYLLK